MADGISESLQWQLLRFVDPAPPWLWETFGEAQRGEAIAASVKVMRVVAEAQLEFVTTLEALANGATQER